MTELILGMTHLALFRLFPLNSIFHLIVVS